MLKETLSVMKNFILIEPTNVKVTYTRNFLLTLCTAVKLAIKRIEDPIKLSVKNLIWNHPQQSQRSGFSLCFNTSLLANNILERGWIMCLSFEWLLGQAALFLNFLPKHLGVNVK